MAFKHFKQPRKRVFPADLPDTYEGWSEFVFQYQLPKLGTGCSRVVYALDKKRVLKLGDYQACCDEAFTWEDADERKRQYLATIYAHGPGWIIMERAKKTLAKFTKWNYHKQDEIATSSGLTMHNTGIIDLHGGNIGWFGKNKFKLIDYAA